MPRQRNLPVPEVAFDATKFVGSKAQTFFDKYENKAFAIENEFKPEKLDLDEIFQRYGWGNLARRSDNHGSALLVREFYANAYEAGEVRKCAVVRGKNVWYNDEDINSYYGMVSPGFENEACAYYTSAQIMERNVAGNLDRLAPYFMDIDVTLLRNGNVMKARNLDFRMRALHRFICERIMPTSHYGDVHWRRALLMNIVLSGRNFNTRLTISMEMVNTYKGMGRCNFNFPLLISGLIERAGVNFSRLRIVRDIISSGTAVNKKSLTNKGHTLHPGEGSSRGRRERIVDEEMEEQQFTPSEAAYYMAGHVESLATDIGELRGQFDGFNQRLMGLEESQRQVHSRVTEDLYAASMWRQRMEDEQTAIFREIRDRLPPPPAPQHIPYHPPQYRDPQEMMGWSSWDEQQQQQQQHSPDTSRSGSLGPWDHYYR